MVGCLPERRALFRSANSGDGQHLPWPLYGYGASSMRSSVLRGLRPQAALRAPTLCPARTTSGETPRFSVVRTICRSTDVSGASRSNISRSGRRTGDWHPGGTRRLREALLDRRGSALRAGSSSDGKALLPDGGEHCHQLPIRYLGAADPPTARGPRGIALRERKSGRMVISQAAARDRTQPDEGWK